MKFAIIVALLAVVVNCQAVMVVKNGASPDCKNECALGVAKPLTAAQIPKIKQVVAAAVGPKVAELVKVILKLLQKLPLIKQLSPAAFNLIIKLLEPCGEVEKLLNNGKPVSFTPEQRKSKEELQKKLTPVVGPNTACFLARILTIAKFGSLANLKIVVKLLNLVLCIATNPALVKILQPVLQIVISLLSNGSAGNPVGGLKSVLKNPGGVLKAVLGGVEKCLNQAGLKSLTKGLTKALGLGGIL